VILDNLYADKKAVPMIVVMEKGYATRAGDLAGPRGSGRGDGGAFEEVVLRAPKKMTPWHSVRK